MAAAENIYNEKIKFFQNVINNIYYSLNNYKNLNIVTTNDYNNCVESLEKIINLINTINYDSIISELQYINNGLSSIIKNYGIYNIETLFQICLNNDYLNKLLDNKKYNEKYELIRKYFHPLNYKIINWNNKENNKKTSTLSKNRIFDDKTIIEETDNLECLDLMRSSNNFILRVYGIKLIVHDKSNKRTLCINCIIDETLLNNNINQYVTGKKKLILDYVEANNLNNNELYVKESWDLYYNNLSLKDLIIYNCEELFNKYVYIMTQINIYENKTINSLVQDFIGNDLFGQRNMLINLYINSYKQEFQYISYLLYDVLSDGDNGDTSEQKKIYDSLNWNYKKLFKTAMYKTIEYTSFLSNFDSNKIPLEQQICLMKVKDNIKEKAMQKLKEIKSKSEDSGSKARQYLDGLLKIPFGIYKEEYILNKKHEINDSFKSLIEPLKKIDIDNINNINNNEILTFLNLLKDITNNENYNSLEILNIINIIDNNIQPIYDNIFNYIMENLNSKKKVLIHTIDSINLICKKYKLDTLKTTGKSIELKNYITNFLQNYKENKEPIKEILVLIENLNTNNVYKYLINIEKHLLKIKSKNNDIIEYIDEFNNILDSAVYGHNNAKKQIERIIGQWINGEKSGYCFGFEGPPGVGKTSLAKKGISNCLKDIDGNSRPFSFIALGGSSNGSILDGHNYTYVGSTWGKIVDILIENKCMNPIIFIDELDKVSKTEHGKEIIGILTHLIDSTQNDCFQDKYFSNIDLDLSKALFIFSYNDVELIDKILLDRIHRIKFDNLLLDDKLIISEKYLLPELYKKFGVENIILFENEIVKFIIENYTNEPGVRKLKEIFFEIISTINLDLLKKTEHYNIPIIITKDIVEKILIERDKVRYLKINTLPKVGIINGLWANSFGNSGILHIEAKFFTTSTFLDLKLTGMQGDVMKESMSVSKTLALSLIPENTIKSFIKKSEETKQQGIHIHVPEGATPKDGPSAGAAITLVIYSLLMNKKIKNNYAITGEICLQGKITAIGALDLKIMGGIIAGVKTFLYPKDNSKDFDIFYKKNVEKLEDYEFYEVEHISDVIKHMLIK